MVVFSGIEWHHVGEWHKKYMVFLPRNCKIILDFWFKACSLSVKRFGGMLQSIKLLELLQAAWSSAALYGLPCMFMFR